MPATPAWPPKSAPRLYVEQPLGTGLILPVEGKAAHYLISVMRMKNDDAVLLFDGKSGEWAARAADVRKRDLKLEVIERTRPLEQVPDFWLCVAPIRKGRIDLIAEKACELGVARLQPVMMRRAVVDRLNLVRLGAHLIEAAEQCGRTALPELAEPVSLDTLLNDWPADRHLFFADEEGGPPLGEVLAAHRGPAGLLVGPEGGFDPAEREAVKSHLSARPLSLGPRILRAETAAIAGTAAWMALNGDWSEQRAR